MISLEKWYILTPLQKLHKNVGGLGKFIVAKGLKSCSKSNKSPNQVTLLVTVKKMIWAKILLLSGLESFADFFPFQSKENCVDEIQDIASFRKLVFPPKCSRAAANEFLLKNVKIRLEPVRLFIRSLRLVHTAAENADVYRKRRRLQKTQTLAENACVCCRQMWKIKKS